MKKKCDLRKNILLFWKEGEKERTIKVKGISMKPLIVEGNSITFKPATDINIGDIAVFYKNSQLIAHRIIDKICRDNSTYYMEKGDNTFYPSLISTHDIIGKVVTIKTKSFIFDMQTWYWTAFNLLLGIYWKWLFRFLDTVIVIKKKVAGSKKIPFASYIYKKTYMFMVKIPGTVLKIVNKIK